MIRFTSVTKSYKIGTVTRTIIDDCTIELPSDRALAIFAPPTGGKTTLIHLIAGLTEPTEGQIDRFARVSVPISYMKSLKLRLSPWQNITYASRVYGADISEVAEFVERITQLGELMHEPLTKLSVQDRLAFTATLNYALPFDTYLVDGAFGLGTPEFRRKCLAMAEARAATGGLIYATSHKPVALRLCDTGAVLHKGKIRLFDDVREAAEAFDRIEATSHMERDLSGLEDDVEPGSEEQALDEAS